MAQGLRSQCRRCRRHPWIRKILRSKWQLTPVFFPGKFHGQRSLPGYSPLGCKEWPSTSLVFYLRVELLDHMSTLCLTFWETVRLFSKVAEPCYITISSLQGLPFLHTFANTYYYLSVFKVLLEHHHAHSFTNYLWLLSQCNDIPYMKDTIIYHLALSRKSLSATAIEVF